MAVISPSRRLRRTHFSEGVEAAGGNGHTDDNHMLLPTDFRSIEEDFRQLKAAVQVWDGTPGRGAGWRPAGGGESAGLAVSAGARGQPLALPEVFGDPKKQGVEQDDNQRIGG